MLTRFPCPTTIYTSGTTGASKGIMRRFADFPSFTKAVIQVTGKSATLRDFLPAAGAHHEPKGKYVAPAIIELMLDVHGAIESCLVMGSGLAATFAAVFSSEAQQSGELLGGRYELEQFWENLLKGVNAKLAPHEQLRFLVLTRSKWSVENGFITPTLKLKRQVLEAYYSPSIPIWIGANMSFIRHAKDSKW